MNAYSDLDHFSDFDDLDIPRTTFWSDLGSLLFSFDGRIDQGQAVMGLIAATLVNAAVFVGGFSLLLAASSSMGRSGSGLLDGLLVLWVFFVAILSGWTSLALQVKRWHDIGRSGWYVLLGIIPYVGPLIALGAYLGLPSESRPNGYGPRPRGTFRPSTPADLQDDDYTFLQEGGSSSTSVEAEWL